FGRGLRPESMSMLNRTAQLLRVSRACRGEFRGQRSVPAAIVYPKRAGAPVACVRLQRACRRDNRRACRDSFLSQSVTRDAAVRNVEPTYRELVRLIVDALCRGQLLFALVEIE